MKHAELRVPKYLHSIPDANGCYRGVTEPSGTWHPTEKKLRRGPYSGEGGTLTSLKVREFAIIKGYLFSENLWDIDISVFEICAEL